MINAYTTDNLFQWEKFEGFSKSDIMAIEDSFSGFSKDTTFWKSKYVDFYGDIGLFEKRKGENTYPKRFLYNAKTGKVFDIIGNDNRPIYDANKDARLFDPTRPTKKNIDELGKKYIRFFFAHVEGKHGAFDIFENYPDIEFYSKLFHDLDPDKVKNYEKRADKSLIRKLIVESLVSYINNHGVHLNLIEQKSINDTETRLVYDVYMFFKNAMFHSEAHIFTNPSMEKWGIIELQKSRFVLPDYNVGESAIEKEYSPFYKYYDRFINLEISDELPPLHLLHLP